MTLRVVVKSLRETRDWSLSELAKRSHIAKSYLWSLEEGTQTNPSIGILICLADAFGVRVGLLAEAARETWFAPIE